LLFGVYVGVPNNKASNDNYAHCLTALSLVRGEKGSLNELQDLWASAELEQRATIIEAERGQVVGGTGIGAALAIAPFYWVAKTLGADSLLLLSPQLNHLIAAVWSVLAVLALAGVVHRQVDRAPAWLATAAFALGSSVFSVCSREVWQHTFVVALAAAAFWLLLGGADRPGKGHALSAGLLLGWAGLVRPTGFVYVLLFLWLARRIDRRLVGPLLAGVMPGLLFTLAYNWWTFGSPLLFGQLIIGRVRFAYEASQHVPFDPVTAFAGLLVSPGRGLFVYSPITLWALIVLSLLAVWRSGGVESGRDEQPQHRWPVWLAPALAMVAINVLSAAAWKEWAGGWTWGPRYLSDTLPAWGLVVAAAAQGALVRKRSARWLGALAGLALTLSIAHHAAVLLANPYRPDGYSARNDPDYHPERLWRWSEFPPLDNLRLWREDRAQARYPVEKAR
jgi:hypothetical protein